MKRLELDSIQARLDASRGDWALDPSDATKIMVSGIDGTVHCLRAMRDFEPASRGDVIFIANLKHDLTLLLQAERNSHVVDTSNLQEIRVRLNQASPGPWIPFVESDGGHGGSSVIAITLEDTPDLYLWLDDAIAPDEDYRLVGEGRQDVERLFALASARRSNG